MGHDLEEKERTLRSAWDDQEKGTTSKAAKTQGDNEQQSMRPAFQLNRLSGF